MLGRRALIRGFNANSPAFIAFHVVGSSACSCVCVPLIFFFLFLLFLYCTNLLITFFCYHDAMFHEKMFLLFLSRVTEAEQICIVSDFSRPVPQKVENVLALLKQAPIRFQVSI